MKLIIALGMCAGLLGENARAEGTNMAASVPQSMESFDRNSDNERFNRAVAAPLSSEERGRGEVELLFQSIERLQKGQQQLLKEMTELRKALEEKSGGTNRAAAPARPAVIPLDVRGEPFRGQSEARVAIIEYSDFACPYCAEYVREVYPRVEADYIKPGKVRYFFRDLPERDHTNALAAAQAARCAGEQGKFWEMHDLLFAAQPALGRPDLLAYAQGFGLDTETFKTCLASDRWVEPIHRSAAGARRMQLYGTPAFLIGTVSEDGNVVQATRTVIGGSFDELKSALDMVLTAESKPLALVKPN